MSGGSSPSIGSPRDAAPQRLFMPAKAQTARIRHHVPCLGRGLERLEVRRPLAVTVTAPIDDVVMSLGSAVAPAVIRLPNHFDGGGGELEYTVSNLFGYVSTVVDATGTLTIHRAPTVPNGFVKAIDQLVVRAASKNDANDYRELGFNVTQSTPVRVGNALVGKSHGAVMVTPTALSSTASGPRFERPVGVPRPPVQGPLSTLVGDFNGDHADDVALIDGRGGVWVTLTTDGTRFPSVARWGSLPAGQRWQPFVVADFTGDGLSDIAARNTATGNWRVLVSTGGRFTGPVLFGNWSTRVDWQEIVTGDFDGDNAADIATRHAETGQWWISYSLGNRFVSVASGRFADGFRESITVGDFNGDGRSDLAARNPRSGLWGVLVSQGRRFGRQEVFGAWSAAVRWQDLLVGDFDADGRTDLAARAPQTGQWIVSRSRGSTFGTTLLAGFGGPTPGLTFSAGDFNFDGKTDILAGDLKTGVWRMLASTGTGFAPPALLGRLPQTAGWKEVAPIRIGYAVGSYQSDGAGSGYLPSGSISLPSGSFFLPSGTLAGGWTHGSDSWTGGTVLTPPPTTVAPPIFGSGTTVGVTSGVTFILSGSLSLTGPGTSFSRLMLQASGTFDRPLILTGFGLCVDGSGGRTLVAAAGCTLGNAGFAEIRIAAASPPGVAGTDWSLLQVRGPLEITATSAQPFEILLRTLRDVLIDPAVDHAWTIMEADGGINGFSADKFVIRVAPGDVGLAGLATNGDFSLVHSGNALQVRYTPRGTESIAGA